MREDMSLGTPKGAKVVFLNKNGMYGDRTQAVSIGLVPNALYTVSRLRIGGFSSEVFLEEFPNIGFNTTMFGNVRPLKTEEQTSEWMDDFAERYSL